MYSVLEGQTRYVLTQLVEAVRYTRKVAGSVDIFHCLIPSGRTMVLGSIQPLPEMNSRYIWRGVDVAGAWGWQPYHLRVPIV